MVRWLPSSHPSWIRSDNFWDHSWLVTAKWAQVSSLRGWVSNLPLHSSRGVERGAHVSPPHPNQSGYGGIFVTIRRVLRGRGFPRDESTTSYGEHKLVWWDGGRFGDCCGISRVAAAASSDVVVCQASCMVRKETLAPGCHGSSGQARYGQTHPCHIYNSLPSRVFSLGGFSLLLGH